MIFESSRGPIFVASRPCRPPSDRVEDHPQVERDRVIYTMHRLHRWDARRLAPVFDLSIRQVRRIIAELRAIEAKAHEQAMG